MRMRLVAIVLCVGISVTVPLLSHHAFSSEFDANKPVKLKEPFHGLNGSTRTHGFTST